MPGFPSACLKPSSAPPPVTQPPFVPGGGGSPIKAVSHPLSVEMGDYIKLWVGCGHLTTVLPHSPAKQVSEVASCLPTLTVPHFYTQIASSLSPWGLPWAAPALICAPSHGLCVRGLLESSALALRFSCDSKTRKWCSWKFIDFSPPQSCVSTAHKPAARGYLAPPRAHTHTHTCVHIHKCMLP